MFAHYLYCFNFQLESYITINVYYAINPLNDFYLFKVYLKYLLTL